MTAPLAVLDREHADVGLRRTGRPPIAANATIEQARTMSFRMAPSQVSGLGVGPG